MNLEKISEIQNNIKVKKHFEDNTERKNFFLAVCYFHDPIVDLKLINEKAPFGGIIGIGDSKLEKVFGKFKIFKLHAVLHDAAGFMKTNYSMGPGYVYFSNQFSRLNSCLLGHVSGIIYCIYLSIVYKKVYESFNL